MIDERCIVIIDKLHRNCLSKRKKGSKYCARHSKLWDKELKSEEKKDET